MPAALDIELLKDGLELTELFIKGGVRRRIDNKVPDISVERVMKAAGLIESMSLQTLKPRSK